MLKVFNDVDSYLERNTLPPLINRFQFYKQVFMTLRHLTDTSATTAHPFINEEVVKGYQELASGEECEISLLELRQRYNKYYDMAINSLS